MMTRYGAVAMPIALLVWAAAAGAADLTKVDRTLKKEPAYQGKPKYCLLVFGPEAKHRVWLVLDGDTLYVDKNGNGDLTNEGKRVTAPAFNALTHPAYARERSIEAGDITVGGLTHTGLVVNQTQCRRKFDASAGTGLYTPEEWQEYLDSTWRQVPDGLIYMVSINLDPKCYGRFAEAKGRRVLHSAWCDQQGQLAFADRPQDAPVLHFGGPLTLRINPSDKLRRGKDAGKTNLYLGTPGLEPGSFVTMGYDLVPKDIHPAVEVRFPAKEPGQQGVTRKYVLKQRC
jgi:hypothetical protein